MSELLVQVREKSIEAVHVGDIKALYTLVENHHADLTDEIEQGLYGNILDLALELLTNTLETQAKLSLTKDQEKYTLRALYEYAISHYSGEQFLDAKALFEVLEGTAKEENFQESMRIHASACAQKIDINEFLDKYCEVKEKMDDFYITEFTKEAQKLLDMANTKKDS